MYDNLHFRLPCSTLEKHEMVTRVLLCIYVASCIIGCWSSEDPPKWEGYLRVLLSFCWQKADMHGYFRSFLQCICTNTMSYQLETTNSFTKNQYFTKSNSRQSVIKNPCYIHNSNMTFLFHRPVGLVCWDNHPSIMSHGDDFYHDSNIHQWFISVSKYFAVYLKIHTLFLSTKFYCGHLSLRIYDGPISNKLIIFDGCGKYVGLDVISATNQINLALNNKKRLPNYLHHRHVMLASFQVYVLPASAQSSVSFYSHYVVHKSLLGTHTRVTLLTEHFQVIRNIRAYINECDVKRDSLLTFPSKHVTLPRKVVITSPCGSLYIKGLQGYTWISHIWNIILPPTIQTEILLVYANLLYTNKDCAASYIEIRNLKPRGEKGTLLARLCNKYKDWHLSTSSSRSLVHLHHDLKYWTGIGLNVHFQAACVYHVLEQHAIYKERIIWVLYLRRWNSINPIQKNIIFVTFKTKTRQNYFMELTCVFFIKYYLKLHLYDGPSARMSPIKTITKTHNLYHFLKITLATKGFYFSFGIHYNVHVGCINITNTINPQSGDYDEHNSYPGFMRINLTSIKLEEHSSMRAFHLSHNNSLKLALALPNNYVHISADVRKIVLVAPYTMYVRIHLMTFEWTGDLNNGCGTGGFVLINNGEDERERVFGPYCDRKSLLPLNDTSRIFFVSSADQMLLVYYKYNIGEHFCLEVNVNVTECIGITQVCNSPHRLELPYKLTARGDMVVYNTVKLVAQSVRSSGNACYIVQHIPADQEIENIHETQYCFVTLTSRHTTNVQLIIQNVNPFTVRFAPYISIFQTLVSIDCEEKFRIKGLGNFVPNHVQQFLSFTSFIAGIFAVDLEGYCGQLRYNIIILVKVKPQSCQHYIYSKTGTYHLSNPSHRKCFVADLVGKWENIHLSFYPRQGVSHYTRFPFSGCMHLIIAQSCKSIYSFGLYTLFREYQVEDRTFKMSMLPLMYFFWENINMFQFHWKFDITMDGVGSGNYFILANISLTRIIRSRLYPKCKFQLSIKPDIFNFLKQYRTFPRFNLHLSINKSLRFFNKLHSYQSKYFGLNNNSWQSAFKHCRREGSHLIIINNEEELFSIQRLFPSYEREVVWTLYLYNIVYIASMLYIGFIHSQVSFSVMKQLILHHNSVIFFFMEIGMCLHIDVNVCTICYIINIETFYGE